jgi:hypothetical protein
MKKQGKQEQRFSSFLVLDFEATCERGTEIRPQVRDSGLSFLHYLGFIYLVLRGMSFFVYFVLLCIII